MSWQEIVEGMQDLQGQLRLVVIPGINGCTVIDDTYNASPTSMVAALNLLSDLSPEGNGRRVAVLGDMLELGDMTEDGHKLVGRRAASVVDLLVTVGALGRSIADEAKEVGLPDFRIKARDDAASVVSLLNNELRTGDLVLVKGSRAVGMEDIAAAITSSHILSNDSVDNDRKEVQG
jgi:UDP-N-acetylmuramoyl-tripeptide--D-alanyl-D-alanine ligase